MILAGGRGTRLGEITDNKAKPSVFFGGSYHLIDFPLSNCANSGINKVGVLTQYQPRQLHNLLVNSNIWGFEGPETGLELLPPYIKMNDENWYLGTANAIYQNIDYLKQHDPDQVLILAADHIYKMDYKKMVSAHRKNGADLTIAVTVVDPEITSQFGIMTTDNQNKIKKFEEKPKTTNSNLASMGIYVFDWPLLKELLIKDNKDSQSDHDFGKDIIPSLIENEGNVYGYPFNGYWKDVGTIQKYWESHMELLQEDPPLELNDPSWPIYTKKLQLPSLYVNANARINNSIIGEGSNIKGHIFNSVISHQVNIYSNSTIKNSIIMPGVTVGSNSLIKNSIVCENALIEHNCKIGKTGYNSSEITIIKENSHVQDYNVVQAAL